jgi:DNA modification methylase/DNA-binding XRE family transcriptional regulator
MTNWSVQQALRTRREQLGLSQGDVAQLLGVSKSFLSHVESGNRQLADEQISILAKVLRLPPDLLALGAGRLPDDVREAITAHTAELVAVVRKHTESEAVVLSRAPAEVLLPKTSGIPESIKLPPERIDAQKTSSSYRAHSYHTKIPPEAITPFIRAFTRPGETVLDPFCGSGMTGVAALMEQRNALLSDLSPAAVHIARNYTAPCDPTAFTAALAQVEKAVIPTIDWLYRPVSSDRIVEYTTWSDVYRCPACLNRLMYWDAMQASGGIGDDGISCPTCHTVSRKTDLDWIGEEPVQSHTSQGSNRIDTHAPTREELQLIEGSAQAPIPYWTPDVSFGADREMWRAGHRAMGIVSVAGFFTQRNLHALAALRHAIVGHSEGRVREALLFAFTAAVNRASRRYQWNAKRPTNVMTGTLYISSLRYEWNVWSLFRRKAADVLRYYKAFPKSSGHAEVFQRSATALDCLPDRSIDFVFMDPPFGANIFYADSSLLWDAWLGQMTDEKSEIVVNKHRGAREGGKTIAEYGDLMQQSFGHAARVLKSGGRAVLAFSNSDDKVWKSIQNALTEAGLDTASVHLLSKGQPSIKGVKGITGKEHVTTFDLMLCLQHRSRRVATTVPNSPPSTRIDQVIRSLLTAGGARNDEIYSAVIRATLAGDYSVAGITMPSIARRCRELGGYEIEGRWMLEPTIRNPEGNIDFISGYLAGPNDLPVGKGGPAITKPMAALRVEGGRGSTAYLAHSYHTKIPPEAITPFIEHYSKPGDVVLDPFSGSGMTGVAASLSGRRAILNDISPAAAHLAWNHTRVCDPKALEAGFAAIEKKVLTEFASLYRTRASDGQIARIHWTLWSTRHDCPECDRRFLLWDVIDRTTGRLGRSIACPHCESLLRRSRLRTVDSVPAWIAFKTKDGKRGEKAASQTDVKHALSHSREDVEAWYPDTPLRSDREMYIRCALQLQNVGLVADLYTPRNLRALALIWREIQISKDERVKRALAFAFTNTAWHGTRMRRFNARGGQRPLTGTLYIPQLSSEANVLEVMRNKIAQLCRYYRTFEPSDIDPPAVILGSATALHLIPNGSIDYIFTDPPFGSNIFYADCNLVWESWLGRLTDLSKEAVINRSLPEVKGGKSLADYASLIGSAMKEMARVLKPGGWATVVFHSTDAAVWNAIRNAAGLAGFIFHEAASLDRQQQSHKGYKGRSGTENVAHFDVVMNLRKGNESVCAKPSTHSGKRVNLEKMVASALRDEQVAKHGLQGVHAEVMRRLASNGKGAFVDFADVRAVWERLSGSVTSLALAAE